MERGEKQREEGDAWCAEQKYLPGFVDVFEAATAGKRKAASMSFDGVSRLKIGTFSVEVSEKSMTWKFQKTAFCERVNSYVIFS